MRRFYLSLKAPPLISSLARGMAAASTSPALGFFCSLAGKPLYVSDGTLEVDAWLFKASAVATSLF